MDTKPHAGSESPIYVIQNGKNVRKLWFAYPRTHGGSLEKKNYLPEATLHIRRTHSFAFMTIPWCTWFCAWAWCYTYLGLLPASYSWPVTALAGAQWHSRQCTALILFVWANTDLVWLLARARCLFLRLPLGLSTACRTKNPCDFLKYLLIVCSLGSQHKSKKIWIIPPVFLLNISSGKSLPVVYEMSLRVIGAC